MATQDPHDRKELDVDSTMPHTRTSLGPNHEEDETLPFGADGDAVSKDHLEPGIYQLVSCGTRLTMESVDNDQAPVVGGNKRENIERQKWLVEWDGHGVTISNVADTGFVSVEAKAYSGANIITSANRVIWRVEYVKDTNTYKFHWPNEKLYLGIKPKGLLGTLSSGRDHSRVQLLAENTRSMQDIQWRLILLQPRNSGTPVIVNENL